MPRSRSVSWPGGGPPEVRLAAGPWPAGLARACPACAGRPPLRPALEAPSRLCASALRAASDVPGPGRACGPDGGGGGIAGALGARPYWAVAAPLGWGCPGRSPLGCPVPGPALRVSASAMRPPPPPLLPQLPRARVRGPDARRITECVGLEPRTKRLGEESLGRRRPDSRRGLPGRSPAASRSRRLALARPPVCEPRPEKSSTGNRTRAAARPLCHRRGRAEIFCRGTASCMT